MRWFYHRSQLLRHDNRFYLKPFLLKVIHSMMVVTHPHDFRIYRNKIVFRSYGSLMSVQGYYVGEIEYHLVKYVIDQIKPGFTMLDIGAHHGVYTLIPAYELKSRGWKGIIQSFEPNPFNCSLLKHNVRRNALTSFVVLHNEAVSDKHCRQKLFFYPDENSDSQLESVQTMDRKGLHQKSVQVIKLDTIMKSIRKVHLIKMDVQGAELFVLKGGEKLINRDKPILVIEAVREWSSTEKIINFLKHHDYSIRGVDKTGALCPYDSPDIYVSWDLVGIPH